MPEIKIKKILIVEDDKNLLNMIERFLKRNKYTCLNAMNAVSALEIIRTNKLDLIISDIRMA